MLMVGIKVTLCSWLGLQ